MDDMSLIYNINLCRLCQIPDNLDLISTSSKTETGETYLDILKYIFGEIIWVEDDLISLACKKCVLKINDIAVFKKICLDTNYRRGLLNFNFIKCEEEALMPDFDADILDVPADLEITEFGSLIENNLESDTEVSRKRKLGPTEQNLNSKRKKEEEPSLEIVNNIDKVEVEVFQLDSLNIDAKELQSLNHIKAATKQGKRNSNKSKFRRLINRPKRVRNLGKSCNTCKISYKSSAALDRHIFNQHNGVRKYICSICERAYITKDDLTGHLMAVHSDKGQFKYLCTDCGAKFYKLSVLQNHIEARHKKIYNYLCTICNKDLITSENLKKHILIHANIDEETTTDQWQSVKIEESIDNQFSKARTKTIENGEIDEITILQKSDGIKKKRANSSLGSGRARTLKITCDICFIPCVTVAELDRHVYNQHNGTKKYICAVCWRRYITKDDLSGHLKAVHTDKTLYKFLCTECGEKFYKLSVLQKHTETRHNTNFSTYENLDEQSDEKNTKGILKAGRKRNLKIICDICKIPCVSIADRDRHVYNRHNGYRRHICAICERAYITKDDLSGHMKSVHADKEKFDFLCTECGEKFYKLSVLQKHVETRHKQNRNFACTVCDNKFTTNGNLKSHMLTHSNAREFKCDLCNAEYKRKDSYLIHRTQKHGIGKYKCNRYLKSKDHVCSMCDQRFNTRPRLLIHIRKHHTDVEPFCTTP